MEHAEQIFIFSRGVVDDSHGYLENKLSKQLEEQVKVPEMVAFLGKLHLRDTNDVRVCNGASGRI